LLEALDRRHAAFHEAGCRASDHGLEQIYADEWSDEVAATFDRVRAGKSVEAGAARRYKSALLHRFALIDHARGRVQQYHLGALRNTNTRMRRVLGADSGLDSIGDFEMARPMARFFDRLDSTTRGDLAETASAIERLGRRAIRINADLADRNAVEAILDRAGDAEILVNNAGIIRRAPLLDYSDADWDAVIEVNLRSIFALLRAFARRLVDRNRGGRIINVASMLSFQGGVRVAAYTAAKSGLLGLTRAMANELAPRDINVNAIAPGYMATDNTQALRDDPQRSSEILARIPAGRWGTPDDLRGAVVYLASPAAAYVHGTVLTVDGGWLAR
jgi:2-deoxy-D-gluconate 3-dehydrogenase